MARKGNLQFVLTAETQQFNKNIRVAGKNVDGFGKNMGGVSGLANKFGGGLATLAKRGFQAVGIAAGAAAKTFIEFQNAMSESLAIMQTTTEQEQRMADAAREVATSTTISATEAAQSFFYLASAGLDAEQSIASLTQVAKFAQAGAFDMSLATDLATDAQSALGLSVKDATQNLENLTRVTDVLVKANTLANATVQQFSEALTNKAGAALNVANKSIEEGVAVLALFADQGVKASEAGEKLNVFLRDVPRAAARSPEVFKQFNIDVFDANGNLKNLADVVEEFSVALGPMNDGTKAAALEQLGLTRSVGDAIKLLINGEDKIRAYERSLNDAAGTTEEIAAKQLVSLQKQAKIAFNELGVAATLIGSEFEPEMRSAIEAISDFADYLSTEFLTTVKAVAGSIDILSATFKLYDDGTDEATKGTGFFATGLLTLSNNVLQLQKGIVILKSMFGEYENAQGNLVQQSYALIEAQQRYNTALIYGEDATKAGLIALNKYMGSGINPTIYGVQELIDATGLSAEKIKEQLVATNKTQSGLENYDQILNAVNTILAEQAMTTQRSVRQQMFFGNATDNVAKAQAEAARQAEINKLALFGLEDAINLVDNGYSKQYFDTLRVTQATEDQLRSVRLLDDEYKDGLLKTLGKVSGAFTKLENFQNRGVDEAKDLEDADKEVSRAKDNLSLANNALTEAQNRLNNVTSDGTEINIREALELQNLSARVADLNEQYDKGEASLLELQVAQLDLAEAQQRAKEVSNEYLGLQREVQLAEENVKRAEEDLTRANDLRTEAQNRLNDATKITTASLFEQAEMVVELQQIMDSFSGEGFTDTLHLISQLTGIELDKVTQMISDTKRQLDSFLGSTGSTSNLVTNTTTGNTSQSSSVADSSNTVPPATIDTSESSRETGSSVGTGRQAPLKIYTTLNIGNEKFEQITQDALLSIQKKGGTIVLN